MYSVSWRRRRCFLACQVLLGLGLPGHRGLRDGVLLFLAGPAPAFPGPDVVDPIMLKISRGYNSGVFGTWCSVVAFPGFAVKIKKCTVRRAGSDGEV